MKTNAYIVLGLVITFFASMVSFQIVDTTKPFFSTDLTVPKDDATYQNLEWATCFVADPETGIRSVEFSVWTDETPWDCEFFDLEKTGQTYSFAVTPGNGGGPSHYYEVWAYHFDRTWEAGTYRFHFIAYNNQGSNADFPDAPNRFTVDPASSETTPGPIQEEGPEQIPAPSFPSQPSVGFSYDFPILLFAVGAVFIVYGFTHRKKKVKM